ncbi:major facilitator superfamily domain-containing protein [Pilaira anomala]|nr:major facilitator superfamily domain-containing protein [Pilaira anomala]
MKAKEEEDTTSVASTTVIVIPTSISHPSFQLKTYPQAWFALLLLVLLRTAVSVFQFTFSVIPSMTAQFFHVSMSAVNWLATVQCIVYVIVSFFTGFIFEKLGVKRSIMASGFLCALGCSIRSLAVKTIPPSYALAMVGQIVGGIAAPMALNIMTMLNLVSGFAALVFLPLMFIPEKPRTPPMRVQESDRPSFFDGLVILSKNLNFWILFVVHSLNVGLSISFCALFAQIVEPHGYSNSDAGQLNALAFFAGTLGCFQKDSYAAILFVLTMNQFFLSFLVPVVIELGSETSYPVAEATTNSILWQGSQLFGFIFVLVMDATRREDSVPENDMTVALIFQAAIAGVMAVLALLFHGNMARSEAAAWEQRTLERLNELTGKDSTHLPSNLYPLSTALGVTLIDPPTIADDNEEAAILLKRTRLSISDDNV